MTNEQRDIYWMLCLAGKTDEAIEYKKKCEKKIIEKIKEGFREP